MLGEAAAVKALENQLRRGGLKLTALLTPLRLSGVKQNRTPTWTWSKSTAQLQFDEGGDSYDYCLILHMLIITE